MWAVHDGVGALDRGKPTVLVATQNFEAMARILAKQRGYPEPRLAVLPYPLEGLPEAKVRAIARAHFAPMLEALGVMR
jgi:hypothetical protein